MDPRRIVALLKRIEWSVAKPGMRLRACPDCGAMKPAHFNDCELVLALAYATDAGDDAGVFLGKLRGLSADYREGALRYLDQLHREQADYLQAVKEAPLISAESFARLWDVEDG